MHKINLRLAGITFSIVSLTFAFAASIAYAGSIAGTVLFDGTPPVMKEIKTDSDPYCVLQHASNPLKKETAVIGANGGLGNVFLYVTGEEIDVMVEDEEFDTPETPVVLNQHGCNYEPHVFGIMVGQPLEIRNSDETLHNVHAMPTKGGAFNIGMPGKPEPWSLTKMFKNPEVMVKIKCDVHSWMSAYAGVMAHPYFAVTDGEGGFTIGDLPDGDYTLVAWHEKLGTQEQAVTITGDGTSSAEFHFAAPAEA